MEAANEAFRQLWSELEKEDLAKSKKQAKVSLQRKARLRQKAKSRGPSSRSKKPVRNIYESCFEKDAPLQHFGRIEKPLPGSKKSRSKLRLFVLPNEVWVVLLSCLPARDKIRLALTSRSVYQKVWNLWLHEARHLCHAEMEREWNRMAELCFARQRKDGEHRETEIVFLLVLSLETT